MAPKVPEKQHSPQEQQQQPIQPPQPPVQQRLVNGHPIAIKHSNPFHISAFTLCHNKRLKLKRSKYGECLRNFKNRVIQPKSSHNTDVRRQRLSLLQADVTIDLLSDEEQEAAKRKLKESAKQYEAAYPERMCLERAAILGLMPVERAINPPPLVPITTSHQPNLPPPTKQQNLLMVPLIQKPQQAQPRKRKSKPQKRRSLPSNLRPPILVNTESIVLSDDSNDGSLGLTPFNPSLSMGILVPPSDISVTCPTSSKIPCLPTTNTMQVDEEVTISLVPRSLNTTNCASRSASNNLNNSTPLHQPVFPMLPDETTVHTVIANRIYELSLTKLREGLASCGIPEFADGQQKISPQRRKGMVQQPPVVSPPQAPISLKLSSDLSISLISDDEDETRHKRDQHEPILSPAFLQKLPINVSIAPVPMRTPTSNHTAEPRKLKFG